jgi:hypothetical protein
MLAQHRVDRLERQNAGARRVLRVVGKEACARVVGNQRTLDACPRGGKAHQIHNRSTGLRAIAASEAIEQ